MAATLPYLASYKNVEKLFENIKQARTPEAFTHSFLQNTIGLKGTSDRPMIPLLRALGFIDASGKPTPAYGELKNKSKAGAAVARAIERAYKPLFDAKENANEASQDELRGLIAQVAGTDADMTKKILGTLNQLFKVADFKAAASTGSEDEQEDDEEAENPKDKEGEGKPTKKKVKDALGAGLRPDFHFNIQVHLPANATEEAYLSIFTALRRAFE